jgi:hypothetical protein
MQIARSVRAVIVRGCYIHGTPHAEGEVVDVTPGEFALLSSFRQVELAPEAVPAPPVVAETPKRKTRSEA